MDWGQAAVTVVTIAISSGIIQFFVNRKDKKVEDAKKDHEEELKKEMKDHLTNVNSKWKEDYCDKNSKAIEGLIVGLQEREETGRKRYEEHNLAIEKMNVEHQKDFMELKRAIEKLTENDTKITANIERMAEKQENIADSLVGQAHDRIIFITDNISERGYITNKEKATIKSMYEPYKKLGGNGEVEEAVTYVRNLKVISNDEAREMDIKRRNKQREII